MLKKLAFIFVAQAFLVVAAEAQTPHDSFAESKASECRQCHQEEKVAPTHDGSLWIEGHGPYADKKTSNCVDCHEQSFCIDCHFGGGIDADLHSPTTGPDYMPKSHRTDFREMHPIKAKENPASCSRCHDDRKFCAECHAKFNAADLRVLSHRKGFSNLKIKSKGPAHEIFTPGQCQQCHPNSVLPKHEWSASHAREARKNLGTCQSCHPQGDVCLDCHSAKRGLGRNPHPKGWDSIGPKLESASGRRTCNKCH